MMTNTFVLPEDLQIIALTELPAHVREQLQGDDRDFAVTRPRSRVPSKVIDSQAADLLREFEEPTTLVEAILRFSKSRQQKPTQILEEAYSFLESCLAAKLLVEPGTQSEGIRPSLEKGHIFLSYEIEECLQALTDTEVYRVREGDTSFALKLARNGAGKHVKQSLQREARILEDLDGCLGPRLRASGECEDGRSYLVLEWIAGQRSGEAAEAIRAQAGKPLSEALLRFCGDILDAYAILHGKGVIHSDVHLNNLLIKDDGRVCIVDYGLGRKETSDDTFANVPRAGVPFFYEPEYAKALLAQSVPPSSSYAGEQYAAAALVYSLLCRQSYLDFSYEREEMLRQIVEQAPISLASRGLDGSAALDGVLRRALRKDPASRFSNMKEMAAAFREAAVGALLNVEQKQELPRAAQAEGLSSKERVLSDWVDAVVTRLSDPAIPLPVQGVRFPTASLTYGSAGIAYGLFRIACAQEDAQLFALADRWLDRAAREIGEESGFYHQDVQILPSTVGRVSPYHTPSGVACVQALLAHARGDLNMRAVATERFLQFSNQECENPDITLGRSSTLLAVSLLLDVYRSESGTGSESLTDIGNKLLEGLWEQFNSMPPIRDSEPSTYLGVAHGWAGYLYATLRWMQAAQAPAPANLEKRLQELAGEAKWSGPRACWPSQKRRGSYVLGGWCNGSAGFVFLWSLAQRVLGDSERRGLAEAAGWDTWQSPEEGPSLCCGLTGKAYSQLNLFKHTGESKWLDSAMAMADLAVHNARRLAQSNEVYIPLSLYKGDIGLAVLAAELKHPESAALPFFEEEAWPRAHQEPASPRS